MHLASIRAKKSVKGLLLRLFHRHLRDFSDSLSRLDFIHSGRIAKRFGKVLYEPPRDFYRIGVRRGFREKSH